MEEWLAILPLAGLKEQVCGLKIFGSCFENSQTCLQDSPYPKGRACPSLGTLQHSPVAINNNWDGMNRSSDQFVPTDHTIMIFIS